MNDNQILRLSKDIKSISDITQTDVEDILELLAGNIIDEEVCGQIKEIYSKKV